MPIVLAVERPSAENGAELRLTTAAPAFSRATPSWIHHVVQDPQTPMPLMTRSALDASSRTSSSGAPCPVMVRNFSR